MPEDKRTDVQYLNVLRVLATFAVVSIHISADIVYHTTPIHSVNWWFGNIADSAARWSVPGFVLISGALLLDSNRNESTGNFFKKRMRRILFPLIFWTAAYSSIGLIFSDSTWKKILLSILEGTPYSHLWFIYMIFGLYIFTPFLRTYLRSAPAKEVSFLTYSLLILASLYSLIQNFLFEGQQTIFTMFVPYLGYYLLGYKLHSTHFETIPVKHLVLIIVVCILSMSAGTALSVKNFGLSKGLFLYDYLSPPVIIMSAAAFILVGKLWSAQSELTGFFQNAVDKIVPTTLGIYLIHPLPLLFLRKIMGTSPSSFHSTLSIPMFSVAVFACCYLVVSIMIKVPYLRRTVM